VTARLSGRSSSDWDLAVVDKASGHVLNDPRRQGRTRSQRPR